MADQPAPPEPVLVAEDDATSRLVMEGFLKRLGCAPVLAADGLEAWSLLRRPDGPALALVDWEMPGLDGLELVRRVRSELPERFLYLIMVTARSDRDEIVQGLGAGADDYVTKPFDHRELGVRIGAGQRIVTLQRKLVAANRRLEALAKVDQLTGFYNRLALYRDLQGRFAGEGAAALSVSFIMADLDHFKGINDAHGHDAGDAVLRQFAERVKGLLRQGDVVCRMGGEEFLLIAPETDAARGGQVAERVRAVVAAEPFALPDGQPVAVTCSLGVHTTGVEAADAGFDGPIKEADQALYAAKAAGRNRVVVR